VLHNELCVTAGFNLHSGYDPSVEQMDATFGMLCEARIVRVVIYDYGWGLTRRLREVPIIAKRAPGT
jgi:hypothetical protein